MVTGPQRTMETPFHCLMAFSSLGPGAGTSPMCLLWTPKGTVRAPALNPCMAAANDIFRLRVLAVVQPNNSAKVAKNRLLFFFFFFFFGSLRNLGSSSKNRKGAFCPSSFLFSVNRVPFGSTNHSQFSLGDHPLCATRKLLFCSARKLVILSSFPKTKSKKCQRG